MFKKVVLFSCLILPFSAYAEIKYPELYGGEEFFDFKASAPRELKPYSFVQFIDDGEVLQKEKKVSDNSEKTKIETPKEIEYCRDFIFEGANVNEKSASAIDDVRVRLKPNQKINVNVYYKKDVDLNEREYRRNAVKRSVTIQNYLGSKGTDPAKVSVQLISTEDLQKVNLVNICSKNI